MRYPTCYVMICDADIAVNSAQSSGDFQSTSSFQRFRSLHRRPTLTPCIASMLQARIRITLPLATQQPVSCCPATSVAPTTPNFSGGEIGTHSGGGANGGGSI